MDSKRFDAFARQTSTTHSRRGLAGLVLAGVASRWGGHDAAAKRARKKKGRRCRKFPKLTALICNHLDRKHCRLEPKPNGTPCNLDGQCFDGGCFLAPICQGTGGICDANEHCCSSVCDAHVCQPGAAGALCIVDGDCSSGTCVGFHCT